MLIILVWSFTILLLVVNILFDTSNFWINGTIISGWILFAVQFSYSKWEAFYLLVNKIKFYLFNSNSLLQIKFVFRGDFDRVIFNKLCDNLYTNNNKLVEFQKYITVSNVRKRLISDEIEFEVNFDEDFNEIHVTFKDIRIGYRDILELLQNEVQYLNEIVNKSLNSETNDYYLMIKFKKSNPYFGFYFHRLNNQKINSYFISFTDKESLIEIDSDTISIQSKSYSEYLNITKKYITISSKQ